VRRVSDHRGEVDRGARRGLVVALAVALFTVSACGEGPAEVYMAMATSAQMGDRRGFLEGFTEDSRPLVEAQISLSEAYDLRGNDPVQQLVFPSVLNVETSGDEAILEVARGTVTRRILMVKTDDGWRIDTRRLAEFWEREARDRGR